MTVDSVAGWVVRLTGVTQVLFGILFWTGHALPLVGLHMAIGMAFVLALLVLVVVAARSGLRLPLVLLAAGYSLFVPVFGMTHARLLPGPGHWIIQMAHLLVGFGAMFIAARLGGFVRARSRARSREPRAADIPALPC
jgi:hypothetical protein